MLLFRSLTIPLIALSLSSAVLADASHRADSHGPIGVMGEHMHKEGEVMFSYRYMLMEMDGNLDGTSSVSTDEILEDYRVAPENMTMEMHMLGAMYAPSDDLTLMLMVPLINNEMDHTMQMMGGMGGMGMMMPMRSEFTTETDGVGDIKVGGLYRLNQTDDSTLILNMTLSLPTGSIDEKDVTGMSMGNKVQLPYSMQLGSGTYDLKPGLTYTNSQPTYSWGAQTIATIRLDENDNDYSLGDRIMATAWYARPFADTFSWSLRGAYEYWGDVDGEDKKLNPMMKNMVPTADPDLRGGQRVDLAAGVNWIIPGSATNRLALELIKPVYQDLNGPQMETDYSLVLGWQLSL
ncbi:alpha amylase [Oceanicoccus sagamiensis]|uniref:Alpha amylase n=1 Tax=Oceanicoccus sagamiensis TaxID=716816 RepID=A0A1X9N9J5_9GAMM|nr:alpha amylase [Oceanicoccus sagamiensis]ARN73851.1 alpha amylase [Oceanicoccus sagamiensis]